MKEIHVVTELVLNVFTLPFVDTVKKIKSSTLSLIEENDPEEENGYKRMMERDERRFKMADENKDMKATKEEFTAFLHPEEYDHMKDIIVMVIKDFVYLKYI